jgi:hypothetical protein
VFGTIRADAWGSSTPRPAHWFDSAYRPWSGW